MLSFICIIHIASGETESRKVCVRLKIPVYALYLDLCET